MTLKTKSFLWWLTWPFAHNNYTLVYDTLYCPNSCEVSSEVILHEQAHARQWKETGLFLFPILYLFCLPVLFNPFRRQWETEAYEQGQGYSKEEIDKLLKSYKYGWLYEDTSNS